MTGSMYSKSIVRSIILALALTLLVSCSHAFSPDGQAQSGRTRDSASLRDSRSDLVQPELGAPLYRAAQDSSARILELLASWPRAALNVTHDGAGGEISTMSNDLLGSIQYLTLPQVEVIRDQDIASAEEEQRTELVLHATAPIGSGNVCSAEITYYPNEGSYFHTAAIEADSITASLLAAEQENLSLERIAISARDLPHMEETTAAILVNSNLDQFDLVPTLDSVLGQSADPHEASQEEIAQFVTLLELIMQCIDSGGLDQALTGSDTVATPTELMAAGICGEPCLITGVVSYEHPGWGRVRLVTAVPENPHNRTGIIAAIDSNGASRWLYQSKLWSFIRPATRFMDLSGNLFLTISTGDQDSIVVLGPRPGGFESYGTLPDPGYPSKRFQNSQILGPYDGLYRISGGLGPYSYEWNGEDYVQDF